MNIEIERKFLVRGQAWKRSARPVRCRQGYLCAEPGRTVRVRVMGRAGFLAVKGRSAGAARAEYEYRIPYSDACRLLDDICLKPLIEKTRWRLNHEGMCWEIDEFSGANAGLVVAELELASESQPFARPAWLGREVTGDPRYYNASLVARPFRGRGAKRPD